ncbi:MAG TPA: ABC transporter permease [Erysipelothrix sp.]
MNHFKRAWLSVTRRKGKSLILLAVVFILGNLIAGTFAIKQATFRVEDNLKKKLGFNATVAINYNKIYEDFDFSTADQPKMPVISKELIEKLGSLPQVKFFDYAKTHIIDTPSLKSINFNDSEASEFSQFSLRGVEYLELIDSKVGRIELVSGRLFQNEDLNAQIIPIIISENLLLENNLRIDEIIDMSTSLQQLSMESELNAPLKLDYQFKVIGTFKPITFGKNEQQNYSVNAMLNRIYLPNKSVEHILQQEIRLAEENNIDLSDNYFYQEALNKSYQDSVFVTESEQQLMQFTESAQAIIDDTLEIKTSQEAFSMIAAPMAILSQFASITLKGAAITTIIMLSLVVILFLRDRKHEMGIYIALGDKQWKVLSQVTLEVIMITLLGLTLSFGSGLMLANKASNLIIYDNSDQGVMIDTESSFIPAVNMTEVQDDYTIKITPSYIISIYTLGTMVAVCASVVPMFYVTRMKPKKILM